MKIITGGKSQDFMPFENIHTKREKQSKHWLKLLGIENQQIKHLKQICTMKKYKQYVTNHVET